MKKSRIIIPEIVGNSNGSIWTDAFKDASVELVIIPDWIISIGNQAFWKCEKLRYIKLSKNLSYIGVQAFSDCKTLEDFDIPGNIKTISSNAFANCISLRSLTIPQTVETIEFGEYVFYGCKDLTMNIYKSTSITCKSGKWSCYWMSANAYEYINVIYLD